jgi:hypothetical protein
VLAARHGQQREGGRDGRHRSSFSTPRKKGREHAGRWRRHGKGVSRAAGFLCASHGEASGGHGGKAPACSCVGEGGRRLWPLQKNRGESEK